MDMIMDIMDIFIHYLMEFPQGKFEYYRNVVDRVTTKIEVYFYMDGDPISCLPSEGGQPDYSNRVTVLTVVNPTEQQIKEIVGLIKKCPNTDRIWDIFYGEESLRNNTDVWEGTRDFEQSIGE